MRTKAFKDWFGDWELANLYNRALIAWNDKNSKGKVVVDLSEKAKARFKELLGKDISQFVITDDSIRHIKNNHGAREELRGQKNMTPDDVVIIPYLVNNFDSMELNPRYDDKLGNRAIEITKRINGVSVVATIERGNNKEFLVTNYELVRSDALDASNETPGPNVRNDSDIAKVQKDIEDIKQKANNSSKIVDENGEPMVVYHQTNKTIYRNVETGENWDDLDWQEKQEWEERDDWEDYWVEEDFYEFSRTNARTTNEFDGFFFAPKYDEYHEYGDRTIEAFLNIRKPASQDDYYIDAQYNDAGKKERIRLQEEGFDGVIRMEGNEVWEYVAFEPTQIKSATDNVGTFDKTNPDVRYSLQNKYGIKVGENVQIETIRDLFNEWNSNEELSELFDKVYDVASKLTFDIAFNELEKKDALGLYNAAAGLMELSDELLTDKIRTQRKAQTILHELIHSVTTYAMYIDDYKVMQDVFGNLSPNVKKAVDVLNEVYEEIKKDKIFKGEYGITNSKEMVEELANGRFRDKLKEKGLWQKVVEAIKELFGIATDTDTRFDKVNNALNDLLDNFDRSLWAQTASMGEKIFFDKGDDVRYSLASDMARDEQMQSLLKNTPLWNDIAKTMTNADDYTIAVEVLNRLDEDAVNSAKEAIDNANGVFAKADAADVANRLERALQMMRNAEVSEGEGPFGKIYRQFKGKAKEAFDYLMKVKEGDALGVYNRKGIGDIDLVWGDKNGGLAHIISKHIGKGKSFANIEDAQNSISDIINNGGVIFENGDKVVISKNGKIVTLRKNFRVKGKKIADKNWILTAYNENAADNTSAISGINQGQAAPTTAISADKSNANSSDVQAKSGKGAKFSLQGTGGVMDNSIAEYEKRVNTKGKGGKMHLSKFNAMEAMQDEMRALKEVQRIIEKQYGIQLEDFEDAYKAENALSSVNQAEWERYIKDYYEPMMEIIDKWILKGGETEQTINHYLIAKSGLERNREFTVRDAFAEMDKMDRQIINGAYSGTVLKLANALRQGQISQDEYDTQVQEAKDKKNQALENIKSVQNNSHYLV